MRKLYCITLIGLLFLFASHPVLAKDPTLMVQQAYQDILGRPADRNGMRTFRSKIIDEGWTEQQVRQALKNSPEYRRTRADKIITRAYEDLLGRKPDPRGMVNFRKRIIEENWSEKQVRDTIRQSPEYLSGKR